MEKSSQPLKNPRFFKKFIKYTILNLCFTLALLVFVPIGISYNSPQAVMALLENPGDQPLFPDDPLPPDVVPIPPEILPPVQEPQSTPPEVPELTPPDAPSSGGSDCHQSDKIGTTTHCQPGTTQMCTYNIWQDTTCKTGEGGPYACQDSADCGYSAVAPPAQPSQPAAPTCQTDQHNECISCNKSRRVETSTCAEPKIVIASQDDSACNWFNCPPAVQQQPAQPSQPAAPPQSAPPAGPPAGPPQAQAPACFVGKACTCSGASAGACDQCNGGWCNGGQCSSCSAAPAPTQPTQPAAPTSPTTPTLTAQAPTPCPNQPGQAGTKLYCNGTVLGYDLGCTADQWYSDGSVKHYSNCVSSVNSACIGEVTCPAPAQAATPVTPTAQPAAQAPVAAAVPVTQTQTQTNQQAQNNRQTVAVTGGNATGGNATGGSSSATGGSSTVTISGIGGSRPTSAQQILERRVTLAAAPSTPTYVKGMAVTELPKTGLPAIAWAASAFLPLGASLSSFGRRKYKYVNQANYLTEIRKFRKI